MIYRVPSNFPGAGRRVYPGFLQHTGFVAMNPDRHATSHYDYFKDLLKGDDASAEAHRKFYDEYNAVLDMDADYYLDTIKTVFQQFQLVNGTWDVLSVNGKSERVKPGDIKTTAVMTVEGELDDISGSGQTRAALDMCSGVPASMKKHFEAKGAGHYGIFSGRRWRDGVYPAVKAFILEAHKPLTRDERAPVTPKAIARPVSPASSGTPVTPVVAEQLANAALAKPQVAMEAAVEPKATSAVVQAMVKATAKPVMKPVAKAALKPAVKSPVKAAAPATAKPSAKTAVKPVVKPVAKAASKAVAGKSTRGK